MSEIKENKIKKYEIPEGIMEIFDEYTALENLKKEYIKQRWGFRNAVKCGKKAEKARMKFWRKVQKLHPELSGKRVSYDYRECCVYIDE